MSRPRQAGDEVDPAHVQVSEYALEKAIGRQVKRYRKQMGLTITEMCTRTGLSAGMVSKIENGITSPSLATLRSLSTALNVPVTALFREFEEQRDATFVKAGQGLAIERRGTRAGHQYQLLGHSIHSDVAVEPYLITLESDADVFPIFQHTGVEFIYVLQGRMVYRHLNATYTMTPGDSLFFDSDAPHGPDELLELPLRFLSVMSQSSDR
ncbi:MAG: helix-turn-helix transcriptional regulator [Proteobacteria bacterium]|nr:helix-turn-helix transcriptional regulator [Pseudomonadota bacterium]